MLNPFDSLFGKTSTEPEVQGRNNSLSSPEPKESGPFDKWPILEYYQKNDFLRKIETEEDKKNPENAIVVWTFLGLPNKKEAVVYEGALEGEEELNQNPHRIKKIPISDLVAHTNVRAEVRKKEMEGAKAYCEVQNSDFEKEREKRFLKKTEMESLEALPCDMVERTSAKVRSKNRQLKPAEKEEDQYEEEELTVANRKARYLASELSKRSMEEGGESGWLVPTPENIVDHLREEDIRPTFISLLEELPFKTVYSAAKWADNWAEFQSRIAEEKI